MGYTIKDFIDSNKFSGMQLVSDNSGINREIQGVRIIIVPDMENFWGTPFNFSECLVVKRSRDTEHFRFCLKIETFM